MAPACAISKSEENRSPSVSKDFGFPLVIAEDVAWARMRKDRAEEARRNWIKAGKDPLLFIIHPDDIVITEGVGWKIRGPVNEEELKDVLRRRKERDICVGQAMLEDRLATKEEWSQAGDDLKKQPGSLAWFLVHMIDSTLPLRFRLTTIDTIKFDRTYNRMTKRDMLKHMYKLWRSIGKPIPRGRRLPALHDTMPMINAIAGTAALAFKRDQAGNPMEVHEIAREMETRMNVD